VLVELDGNEWDAAHEQLEQDWLAAYTTAFVERAISRGWRRDLARTDPGQIGPSLRGAGFRLRTPHQRHHRSMTSAIDWNIGPSWCSAVSDHRRDANQQAQKDPHDGRRERDLRAVEEPDEPV
jgi:hypothetical protein